MKDLGRVFIDKSKCVGTAMCAELAPGVIAMGDDHKGRPASHEVEITGELLEAIESCPMQALSIEQ